MPILTTRLLAAIVLMFGATVAHGQDWTKWELENALSQERDWLVVQQTDDGTCYLKQSYNRDSTKMELMVGDSGVPAIITPFFRGISGGIEYWVDDREPRVIPASQIEHTAAIKLPRDLVSALKAGTRLFVKVTPRGEGTRTQVFSLLGFTAGMKWLESDRCKFTGSQEATGADGGVALDVTLERISRGRVQVVGQTSLPDGMQLMLGLRNRSIDYSAQNKVAVSKGEFRSDPFSNRGAALPAGTYRVSVSSPLPQLQPVPVRTTIGENGEALSGPAVVQEDGYKRVDWTVQRELR